MWEDEGTTPPASSVQGLWSPCYAILGVKDIPISLMCTIQCRLKWFSNGLKNVLLLIRACVCGGIFYQVGGALLWWVSVDIPESCFPLFCLQCQSRASDHLILSESCQEKGSRGLWIRGFIFPTGKVASLFTDSSSKKQLFLQGIFIYPATERPVYRYITSREQCCVGRKKECRPYELQDTFLDQ